MSPHPLADCQPLGDRILVRIDRVPDRTAGGLVLPDALLKRERPQTGVVVAVGPGKKLDLPPRSAGAYMDRATGMTTAIREPQRVPPDVQPGQRIVFLAFAGHGLDDLRGYDGDDDYLLIREEDVLAVLAAVPAAAESRPD